MTTSVKKTAKRQVQPALPPAHDWRTTDADEINKRRQRARKEPFVITNATPAHPIFANFRVQSASGLTYSVGVRSLAGRQFACECVDFRINGLGVCEHVEAVLLQLEARPALLDAIHALGGALALEHRPPEPAAIKDALHPPSAHCWAGAFPILKAFGDKPVATGWQPAAESLAALLKRGKMRPLRIQHPALPDSRLQRPASHQDVCAAQGPARVERLQRQLADLPSP